MSTFSNIWSIFMEFFNWLFPTWLMGISIQKSNSMVGWSLHLRECNGHTLALQAANQHGKMLQAYFVGQRRVYVNDKYIAKYLMENVHDKRYFHIGDVNVVRRNLFNMRTNAEHKQMRGVFLRSFNSSSLRNMQPRISAISKKAMALFDEACDKGTPLLVDQIFGRLTVDVILSVAFEVEIGALDCTEESMNLERHMKTRMDYAIYAFVPFPGFFQHFSPSVKALHEANTAAYKFVASVFKSLRVIDQEGRLPANSLGKSVLNLVDEVGKKEEDVYGEILVLFLAGHETTAHTLSWFIYSMALHPELQRVCRLEMTREQQDATASPVSVSAGSPHVTPAVPVISPRSLTTLPPYTEACFRESMRLYPALPTAIGRFISAPEGLTIPLEVLNKMDPSVPPPRDWIPYTEPLVLPAKTNINFNNYALHRSKCNWGEAAEEFIPERWMPGFDFQGRPVLEEEPNTTAHNRLASEGVFTGGGSKEGELMFNPFAHGARNCIGMNLALMELRTVIADLMQRYEFTLANPEKFSHEENVMRTAVSLTPVDMMPILVKRRKY